MSCSSIDYSYFMSDPSHSFER